jgi:uncharacterized protein (DUF1800 family)
LTCPADNRGSLRGVDDGGVTPAAGRDRSASVRAGEPDLGIVGRDAEGWLAAQIGPADPARGSGLLDTPARSASSPRSARSAAGEQSAAGHDAEQVVAATIARPDRRCPLAPGHRRATQRPFAERLHWFWANHFTVSVLKGSTRGLVGAFERDAIRPNIAGRFETLLVAATTHPGDAALPRQLALGRAALAGRRARGAARGATDEGPRVSGINENLAREVLELHTLGAEGRATAPTPRPT